MGRHDETIAQLEDWHRHDTEMRDRLISGETVITNDGVDRSEAMAKHLDEKIPLYEGLIAAWRRFNALRPQGREAPRRCDLQRREGHEDRYGR